MPLENRPELPDSAYELAHSGPDAWEQLTLELINRARANPNVEAARQATTLGEDVSTAASQPLAINTDLLDAAQLHSDRMLSANFFAHDDPFTGTTPFDRMLAAGYEYSYASENIGWIGSYDSAYTTNRIESHHNNLWDSIDHRRAFMNNIYSEVGLGFAVGSYDDDGTIYPNSSMITQNFGHDDKTFLTGVVFDDADGDEFYDPGEGQGAVRITAFNAGGSFATATWASGGYTLELASGAYTVIFEGGGLDGYVERSVTIAGQNVKVDVIEDRDVVSFPDDETDQEDAEPLAEMPQSSDDFAATDTNESANLAGVNGRISGSAAEFNGDQITGFGQGDTLVFEGASFSAGQIQFDAATGALTVNSNGIGANEAQLSLFGSFNNAGLLVYRDGDDTLLRTETVVASFSENKSVSASAINGVVVGDYLKGANASEFVLRTEANAGASFANVLGRYEITPTGEIVDVDVLTHNARTASTMSVTGVDAANELAFFIIQNGGNKIANSVLNSDELGLEEIGGTIRLTDAGSVVKGATVFVSHDASLNPDNMEHAISGMARDGSGAVVIGFEDLMRTGNSDDDFQDVAFEVEAIFDIV